MRIALVVTSVLGLAVPVAAQAPAAPAPPPRVEASAQFAFLGATGNASSNTLGAGGEAVWRPDKWVHTAKANFAQIESEQELTARSIAAAFRGSRTTAARLSWYGQYDFLRDVFSGVEQRHVVESGIAYVPVDQPRQRLRLDSALGYLHEQAPGDVTFDTATVSLGAWYRVKLTETQQLHLRTAVSVQPGPGRRLALRPDGCAVGGAQLHLVPESRPHHPVLRRSARGLPDHRHITAVSLAARVRRP